MWLTSSRASAETARSIRKSSMLSSSRLASARWLRGDRSEFESLVTTGACRVGNVSSAGGGAEFLLSAGGSEGEVVCAGSDCWPLNCEGFLVGGGCLRLNSFIEISFSSKPPFGGGSELMMAPVGDVHNARALWR